MSGAFAPFAAQGPGDAVLRHRLTPAAAVLFDLRASAPRLVHEGDETAPGFWLLRVAAGRALLRSERTRLALSAGDLAYGRLGRRLLLSEAAELRLQGVFFPRHGSGARLASLPATPALLPETQAPFLGALLRTAAERLEALTADEMRPLELAILEFLTATAAARGAACQVLHGSAAKNALALRARQTVEVMLAQPDLSPARVAQQVGISRRYLQLLFAAAGETANHYIRRRRLERCAEDLADPLQAGRAIAEICYRWGFADPAYFSRIFRACHGISPSEHRAQARQRGMQRQAA